MTLGTCGAPAAAAASTHQAPCGWPCWLHACRHIAKRVQAYGAAGSNQVPRHASGAQRVLRTVLGRGREQVSQDIPQGRVRVSCGLATASACSRSASPGMQGTRILTDVRTASRPSPPCARLCEGRHSIYPGCRTHAAAGADREAHERGHAHRRQRLVRPPAGRRAGSGRPGRPLRRAGAARSPCSAFPTPHLLRASRRWQRAARAGSASSAGRGDSIPVRAQARAALQRRAGQRTRRQSRASRRRACRPAAEGRRRVPLSSIRCAMLMMCTHLVIDLTD